MSVLAFNAVQAKVAELIAAHAYFAGQYVVANQGRGLDEIEQALREKGQGVVVYPIQGAGEARNGTGSAKMTVNLDVLFAWNPEVGTLSVYDMVTNGISAVIDYFPANIPNDRFQVSGIELLQMDEGLWGYVVSFTKAVQFT
jgi:hypothetical protein